MLLSTSEKELLSFIVLLVKLITLEFVLFGEKLLKHTETVELFVLNSEATFLLELWEQPSELCSIPQKSKAFEHNI